MWPYKDISRSVFENRKEFIGTVFKELGCSVLDINLPYDQKTTTYGSNLKEEWISECPVYQYASRYFRIDEVLFPQVPFFAIECADTLEQVMNNVMEDADPFPYDLSDEEIIQELKHLLGIDALTMCHNQDTISLKS